MIKSSEFLDSREILVNKNDATITDHQVEKVVLNEYKMDWHYPKSKVAQINYNCTMYIR